MEYVILDLNNTSEQQLIDAIIKNHSTTTLIQKEIKKLEQVNRDYQSSQNKLENVKQSDDRIIKKEEKDNSNRDFENEVDYYFSLLDSIPLTDYFYEEIENVLPSKRKSTYYNLIIRLKMELLKNIKDISDLIEEESNDLTKEDLTDFLEEIHLNQQKIDTISKIEENSKNQEKEQIIENNLIFVPTVSGNIRVLEEIDDMDIEYLEPFKKLFDSIKDGTFKNVKRFSNSNNKSAGISEVKDFKIRVVFDRIGKHDYAVITAFMKKSDNDKGYKVSLELKIKNYLAQKEEIKRLLMNSEYREEQTQLEQKLYQKFNSSKTY